MIGRRWSTRTQRHCRGGVFREDTFPVEQTFIWKMFVPIAAVASWGRRANVAGHQVARDVGVPEPSRPSRLPGRPTRPASPTRTAALRSRGCRRR